MRDDPEKRNIRLPNARRAGGTHQSADEAFSDAEVTDFIPFEAASDDAPFAQYADDPDEWEEFEDEEEPDDEEEPEDEEEPDDEEPEDDPYVDGPDDAPRGRRKGK